MTSDYLDKYLSWLPVINTTEERLEQNSANNSHSTTIHPSTKKFNEYSKTSHCQKYNDFVKVKQKILRKTKENSEVPLQPDFSESDYKTYYSSFNATGADGVYDDLFVWSFIEKQGLKADPVEKQEDPIWEPAMNISIDNMQGQCSTVNKNVSVRAAGALLIKKKKLYGYSIHYNTQSSSKSINNNNSCSDVLEETPDNVIEKISHSDTRVVRNKNYKNARRNLNSEINNVNSQASEASESNLTSDFIPEDFQAQSTQIFSDTFTDASVPKYSSTRITCKPLSNDTVNQPRDSGIEEDSRDENPSRPTIESRTSRSLANENSESHSKPQIRHSLKIIGDEQLEKKYKIVKKNNVALKPIVEEKHVPLPESNNKNKVCLKHESDNDSESDFKSIESYDADEFNDEEKPKENSDEYFSEHSYNNALSSEDENVSTPKVKVEPDLDSHSQDDEYDRQSLKDKLKHSSSPWVRKQYKDLERLRLLEDSQDESSTIQDSPNKLQKNKKPINRKKKTISRSNSSSSREHSHERKAQHSREPSIPQDSPKGLQKNKKLQNRKKRNISRSDSSSSREHSYERKAQHSREPSMPQDSPNKGLLKNKKLKSRKQRNISRSNSSSSIEHSYERKTQHNLNGIVENWKDPLPSVENVENYENSHQSCIKDNDAIDFKLEKLKKESTESDHDNSNDSDKEVDTLFSKNNSSDEDSSVLSFSDIVKSKQTKGNDAESRIFTSSDDEQKSEDEKAMSKNQKKQQQNSKKPDLIDSDKLSHSETESIVYENQKSKETNFKPPQISNNVFESWAKEESKVTDKESDNDEIEEDDLVLHTQEKIGKMGKMDLFNSSESEDDTTKTLSIKKHRSQSIDKRPISVKKSGSTHETSSDEEDTKLKNEIKQVQNFEKTDLVASDDSSASETEHKKVDLPHGKKPLCLRDNKISETNSQEIKQEIEDQIGNQSDESDKEDEIQITQQAQKKLQNMTRINFNSTSESDSEIETEIKKSGIAKEQNVGKKSEEVTKSSINRKYEEEMLRNNKNHLQKKETLGQLASDESSDSDEEDQISKSKSKKLSDEKIKSDDSEDEEKTSNIVLQEKVKESENGRRKNSDTDRDSENVHYDSDNIDIKEPKIMMPEDLKHSNLLEILNQSNIVSLSMPNNDAESETIYGKDNKNETDTDEDEKIDNMVSAETSKRMQQLQHLNLYASSDSSDSDEERKNKIVSQNVPKVSKKESDDSSSDEKESIAEVPPNITNKPDKRVRLKSEDEVQDNVPDDGRLQKEVLEKNKDVIIPETQDTEDLMSNYNESQEMFSSMENLAENPSQASLSPQPIVKVVTPTKSNREKMTQIAELVEQEELVKSGLEPTLTLDDVSDDEDIFVIEVPKSIFHEKVIGKKLVVTQSTVSIGNSHYEAVQKNTTPIMSCVLNSKRKKFKTVNIRPLFSIVSRRKKDADDFIENTESSNGALQPKSKKASKLKKQKSLQELEESEKPKKKSSKSKKTDMNDPPGDIEVPGEKSGVPGDKMKKVKSLKRKLYVSNQDTDDVSSDDSCVYTIKKPKNSKTVTDTSEASAKNLHGKVLDSEQENNDGMEVAEQTKSETKVKKKSKKKAIPQETKKEEVVDDVKEEEGMIEHMFNDSFLSNVTIVESEKPRKKKAKKRKITFDSIAEVNSELKAKKNKKASVEEVEKPVAAPEKSKKPRKKAEKPKEEAASVQIMELINNAFKPNSDKLNTSTSSNDSRYGALDIHRVATKKKFLSSSSSDEEKKYSKPRFQIRDKSKEKELTKPSTSSCSNNVVKKEVKDDKKKIKKIYFDE